MIEFPCAATRATETGAGRAGDAPKTIVYTFPFYGKTLTVDLPTDAEGATVEDVPTTFQGVDFGESYGAYQVRDDQGEVLSDAGTPADAREKQ